ncbi:MAG: cobalamin biosynthesis protein [Methanobrevibacter sp.]|jgi:adenosylcobinamide-phosphate synthase|nr:cobalamin biosynthesis protein [Candidatus Methanoflexus mossambicus]
MFSIIDLNNFLFLIPLIIIIIAIIFDLIFGELPVKIHPVVFIGKLIDLFSKPLIKIKNKLSGFILAILVLFVVLFVIAIISSILFDISLLYGINRLYYFNLLYIFDLLANLNITNIISFVLFLILLIFLIIVLSSTFSIKFLFKSAKNVGNDLKNNIRVARKSLSYLVSRNTKDLNDKFILSAIIETLSENITDSVVSVFFYYFLSLDILLILFKLNILNISNLANSLVTNLVNILPNNVINSMNMDIAIENIFNMGIISDIGLFLILIIPILIAISFRTVNTLDGMVGYKNEKYKFIGYFPAKLDDVLNYIPSRFAGLMIVIASAILNLDWKESWKIYRRDSRNTPSPNSGFTMASTAGALNIQLEKKGVYKLGDKNKEIGFKDLNHAIKLNKLACLLSFIVLSIIFYLIYLIFCIFI